MKKILFILSLIVIHLFSSCSGCSKSGRRNISHTNTNSDLNDSPTSHVSSGKTVVKMEKQNGVYIVPIEVNGVLMSFIFDTGASSLCISSTEANFLYKQGKLTDDDILGSERFMDATGTISVGTKIILKTVKIGNKTIGNVEATVIDNSNAPL